MECPYCKGKIQGNALKCKHCGEWIDRSKRPLTSWEVVKRVIAIPIALLGLIFFLAFLLGLIFGGGGDGRHPVINLIFAFLCFLIAAWLWEKPITSWLWEKT